MNYRFFLLFLTFLICLVLSVVVNVIYGIDIVYTHLFYIPIILTGIWYPRYAVFLAATLGLIHIACEYSSAEAFKIGSLLRAAMFMVVAYVTGYLALRRDRLLNSLRESEELYKTLAEKSMAGVYVVQDGKFRFINSNAASYAGYTREELLDQEAGLLVSPEDREKVRQNAKAMLLGEMSSPYEFRIITKEGETRWIMETVTIILHEGRQAILGNSMDITERRWAEEARYHNERLQGVLEMAGAICHEMNQPMQIISGYTEMLLMNISENDPIHTKLDTINKQIHRMGTITRKLMKIKDYDTQDYAGFSRIIDINKSSGKDTE